MRNRQWRLYIETSKLRMCYWTKKSMLRSQILVWQGLTKRRRLTLAPRLLELCKFHFYLGNFILGLYFMSKLFVLEWLISRWKQHWIVVQRIHGTGICVMGLFDLQGRCLQFWSCCIRNCFRKEQHEISTEWEHSMSYGLGKINNLHSKILSLHIYVTGLWSSTHFLCLSLGPCFASKRELTWAGGSEVGIRFQ